jgi:soluble lytic murein transglycosylase-like protein
MDSMPRIAIQSALLVSLVLALFVLLVVPAQATAQGGQPLIYEGRSGSPGEAAMAQPALQAPPDAGVCQVNSRFPEQVVSWCELITGAALKEGLSPDLLAALILVESAGDPKAYSRSGAVGLMQVMPRDGLAAAFQCINGPCFASRPTIAELEDPVFNVEYGTRMLAGLVKRHGNLRDALKAYGPMDVGYSYADKVLSLWDAYRS